MVDDRLTHRLALLGVNGGLIQRTLSETNGTRCHKRTGDVKSTHGNLETITRLTEQVFFRNLNILERDHTGIRAALTHVDFLFAANDTWSVTIHDEARKSLVRTLLRVRASKHKVPVGMTTVRDPHLCSVQNPLIAAFLSTSRDVSHVRASTRLRHAV